MTHEHRHLISFGDILALQFECKNCHAKTSISVFDLRALPHHCSHCNDPWLVDNRTDLHAQTFSAINTLRTLIQQINNNVKNVHCVFSVELVPDTFERKQG